MDGEKPFPCHICTKGFNLYNGFLNHVHTHKGAKVCKVCSFVSSIKVEAEEHKVIHLPSRRSVICPIGRCSASFRDRVYLPGHILTCHPENRDILQQFVADNGVHGDEVQ